MEAPVRSVCDALTHLHDLPYLQTHHLAARHGGARSLQGALADALDRLGAENGRGRLRELLRLRYVDALPAAAVQRRLGLAKSQFYAEHARALAAVASQLAEQLAVRRGSMSTVLPRPPTTFLGRDAEMPTLGALFSRTRLVTLTGPPGVGKTRLALEAAEQLAAGFAGGVTFVPLASVTEASGVLPEIALALDVRDSDGMSLEAALAVMDADTAAAYPLAETD